MKDWFKALPVELQDEWRAHARKASALRKRADTVCQECGAPIADAVQTRRYCGAFCRVKASRKRGPKRRPAAPEA